MRKNNSDGIQYLWVIAVSHITHRDRKASSSANECTVASAARAAASSTLSRSKMRGCSGVGREGGGAVAAEAELPERPELMRGAEARNPKGTVIAQTARRFCFTRRFPIVQYRTLPAE